ncbi:MAG: PorP/SprF family type IX secretion system membrane protein [Flavobacteriales bacterium]|nr:PorP/SprF family type IX secretion system membrane protein [Flavobacteriales bacterium]
MMKKSSIFLAMLCSAIIGFGQDIHFSQFMNSSFLYNPGQTGLINGDHRALLNYRTQWSSIASPYKTYSFTYDTRVFKKEMNKAQMGLGIGFYKDVAGDTEFGTTSITLATSALLKLDDINRLSVGLQGGVMQNSINSNMRWVNQYDGNGYDATINSGETGAFNSTPFVGDFNAGIVWNYGTSESTITSNDLFSMQAGLAVSHISRQRIKITDFDEKLYNRFTLHGKTFIGLKNSPYAVVPGFLWEKQGPSSELLFGSYFRSKLKNESRYTGIFKESALAFGIFYRFGDAFVPKLSLEMMNFNLGVSYDYTVSGLGGPTGGNGGLEVSLQYIVPVEMRYGKGTTPKMY